MKRLKRLGYLLILVVVASLGTSYTFAQDKEPERDPLTRISSTGEILPPAPTASGPDIIHSISSDGTSSRVQLPSYPQKEIEPDSDTNAEVNDDVKPSHIIGPDNRVQSNTNVFPASAVVFIGNRLGTCTGWLYDHNVVATAAHCIHGGGDFALNTRVTAGRNGDYKPFGTCDAQSLHIVGGWADTGLPAYDYGVIRLNCSVGNQTGFFGMKSEVYNPPTAVKGYPGDKPLGTQWGDTGNASDSIAPGLISIDNDTTAGVSGAPVYHNFTDCDPCAFALFQSESNFGPKANFAKHIDNAVFDFFQSWR